MRNRIHRIRQSDRTTKLRWLIGLSSFATLVIVAAWILYMQTFVFTGADQNTKEDIRFGFWPVFKQGLTITGASVRSSFNAIVSDMPAIGRRTTIIENPR